MHVGQGTSKSILCKLLRTRTAHLIDDLRLYDAREALHAAWGAVLTQHCLISLQVRLQVSQSFMSPPCLEAINPHSNSLAKEVHPTSFCSAAQAHIDQV